MEGCPFGTPPPLPPRDNAEVDCNQSGAIPPPLPPRDNTVTPPVPNRASKPPLFAEPQAGDLSSRSLDSNAEECAPNDSVGLAWALPCSEETFVNGIRLTAYQAGAWMEATKDCSALAAARLQPNELEGMLERENATSHFWYDEKSGMFGFEHGPMLSVLDARLPLPPMRKDEAGAPSRAADREGKRTRVYVNGREVHPIDLSHFARMRLAIRQLQPTEASAFWSIDSEGVVRPCTEEGLLLDVTEEEITVSIIQVEHHSSDGSKQIVVVRDAERPAQPAARLTRGNTFTSSLGLITQKMHIPGPSDGYHSFSVVVTAGKLTWNAEPRFSDFVAFHKTVRKLYPSLPLMKFPSKQPTKKQTEQFVRKRALKLERYLRAALNHAVLRENAALLGLLRLPCAILTTNSTRLRKSGFEQPLLSLDETTRIIVGTLLVAVAGRWTGTRLQEVLRSLLHRLLLPANVISSLLAAQDFVEAPPTVDSVLTEEYKWAVIWEILLVSFKMGSIDSRVHVSLQECALRMRLPLKKLLLVEGESAGFLQKKLMELQDQNRTSATKSRNRNVKIAAGAVLGGGILLGAGLIATPLLIPVFLGGVTLAAGLLPVGIGGALLWGGGLMAAVATPTLPVVFGMAGGGLGAHKASRITKGLTEFQFVSLPMASLHEDKKAKRRKKKSIATSTVVHEGVTICTLIEKPRTVKASTETENHRQADERNDHQSADDSNGSNGEEEEEDEEDDEVEEAKNTKEEEEEEEDDDDEDDMLAYEIDWEKGEVREKEKLQELEADVPVEPFPADVVEQFLATGQGQQLAIPKPTSAEVFALKRLESDLAKWDMQKTAEKVARQEEEALDASSNHGIRVGICAQGWLWKKSEVTTLWKSVRDLDPSLEAYSLKWETDALHDLGVCLVKALSSKAATFAAKFWLASMSVLIAGLFSALMVPLMVIALCGAIDNSWTIVKQRAQKAGKALAEVLLAREHGTRPVTLIGVSLGGRVIYYCLKYMLKLSKKRKNVDPLGIIENVFILGGACNSDKAKWASFRQLVAGRLVNGFSKADWVLGLVHRTAGTQMDVAGLRAIEVPGVENYDLTKMVAGHLAYKSRITKLLRVMEIGRSTAINPSSARDRRWADMTIEVDQSDLSSTFSPF